MSNDYKSYYLTDLRAMINSVALEIMMTPTFPGYADSPSEMTIQLNDRLALYNDGIRTMAKELIDRLEGDENTDDA